MSEAEANIAELEDGSGNATYDHVDRVLAQWRKERPDLDVSPVAIIGRLGRVTGYSTRG